MRWIMRLFRRDRLERELDKELRFHVDTEAQRLVDEGVSPREARRRTLAQFGGLDPIKEHARDARGTRWLADLVQDARYALRVMRANKGFSLAAILSLAIGIGANAAVFRVIDALVLRPLAVDRPEELYVVSRTDVTGSNAWRFSYPALTSFREAAPDARFAAMTLPTRLQAVMRDQAEFVETQLVSSNWFALVGVRAAAGRLFSPADDAVGRPPVVVISDRFWSRHFARSASAIGTVLKVNGTPITVVGVADGPFPGIVVGSPVDLWIPVAAQQDVRYMGNASIDDADEDQPWVTQEGIAWLTIVARVGSDRLAVSNAGINGRYRQWLERTYGEVGNPALRERRLRQQIELQPASRGVSPLRLSFSAPLTVLMSMVALVLAVACANLANLLLARGSARSREFALRLSIGARRGRLVRQLLTESLTLAAIAGAASLVVAWWGGAALLRLAAGGGTALPIDMPIDWRIVGFALGVTLVTGIGFGLIPALRLSRSDLQEAIKSGGRVISPGARRHGVPIAKVLVAAQVALSLTLLVGAALFLRTFQHLLDVETGFDRDHVVSARFDTRMAGFSEKELPALYGRLIASAGAIPGVQSATLSQVGAASGSARSSSMVIPTYTPQPGEEPVVFEEAIGPAYFSTVGLSLRLGREFDARDDARSRPVVIVNEALAERYFGRESPLGRTLGYETGKELEVIGVASDARLNGLGAATPAVVYHSLGQHPEEFVRNLHVRVSGPVEPVKTALRQAISTAAPDLAVRYVLTLGELAERTVGTEKLLSQLTSLFGLLGVAVACLGLYGTVSYSVARRTNEIGLRLALGASPTGVRWMVMKETLGLVIIGGVVGLGLVLPLGSLAASMLHGLSPRDPLTLSAATALVIAVGALAGALPAWRASRVSPISALRADG